MNKEDTNHKQCTPFIWGLIFILLGLIGILIGVLEKIPVLNTPFPELGQSIFKEVGIAFFILGFFSIILETKGWREYFEDALSRIVIQQDYLDKLEKDQLIALQGSTLKAYFDDKNLDREGSFLEHFTKTLTKNLTLPYREDAQLEMNVNLIEGNPSIINVFSKITYNCRATKGLIQNKASWGESCDRVESEPIVSIELYKLNEFRQSSSSEGISLNQEKLINPSSILLSLTELKAVSREKSYLFEYDLSEYKDMDGLKVILIAKYQAKIESLRSWQLAYLTKKITFNIHYPSNCLELIHELYGLNSNDALVTHVDGHFSVTYDSWLLPETGITWNFSQRTSNKK